MALAAQAAAEKQAEEAEAARIVAEQNAEEMQVLKEDAEREADRLEILRQEAVAAQKKQLEDAAARIENLKATQQQSVLSFDEKEIEMSQLISSLQIQ